MDDVRAVMDAVGSARAALGGVSAGGPMCSLFAATYPEKTLALVMIGAYAQRLRGAEGGAVCGLCAAAYREKTLARVMIGTYAKRIRDAEYPGGPTAEQREQF